MPPLSAPLQDLLRDLPAKFPHVQLLLLFGSRARGDHHADSDWDFATLAQDAAEIDSLAAALMIALRSDRVDLVDLARAGGVARYHAARDGRLLFEARSGIHERFQTQAVDFWCEVGTAIERDARAVLARLGP